ncbi:hypothetical protein HDU92_008416 [Lobulomyces angularis]|nr:hypothetical protein HDU92_008416 [Lobulomyces angularis]
MTAKETLICCWEYCFQEFKSQEDCYDHAIEKHAVPGKQTCSWMSNQKKCETK